LLVFDHNFQIFACKLLSVTYQFIYLKKKVTKKEESWIVQLGRIRHTLRARERMSSSVDRSRRRARV